MSFIKGFSSATCDKCWTINIHNLLSKTENNPKQELDSSCREKILRFQEKKKNQIIKKCPQGRRKKRDVAMPLLEGCKSCVGKRKYTLRLLN